MKSLTEMNTALAALPKAARTEPTAAKSESTVYDSVVGVIGGLIPKVKKGLVVTAKATVKLADDISTAYKYEDSVCTGKINPNAVAAKEAKNVRARAR